MRRHHRNNPEQVREASRRYYYAHRQEILAKRREKCRTDPEFRKVALERTALRMKKNKDYVLRQAKLYYRNHIDHVRQYQAEHREKINAKRKREN